MKKFQFPRVSLCAHPKSLRTSTLVTRLWACVQANKISPFAFFLRYKSMDIKVPKMASKHLVIKAIKRKFRKLFSETHSLRKLYFFLTRIPLSSKTGDLMKKSENRTLTKNEAVALENISSSLMKHPLKSRFPKAIKRFHLLCLGLIQSVGPLSSYEKQPWPSGNLNYDSSTIERNTAFHHLEEHIPVNNQPLSDQQPLKGQPQEQGNHDNDLSDQPQNGIGCQDMRNASDRHCFGMCGPRCWCWDWLCEDCCLHQACFQHDACCNHAKPVYFSTYCLLPFIYGFDCKEGYMGYPECLHVESSFISV